MALRRQPGRLITFETPPVALSTFVATLTVLVALTFLTLVRPCSGWTRRHRHAHDCAPIRKRLLPHTRYERRTNTVVSAMCVDQSRRACKGHVVARQTLREADTHASHVHSFSRGRRSRVTTHQHFVRPCTHVRRNHRPRGRTCRSPSFFRAVCCFLIRSSRDWPKRASRLALVSISCCLERAQAAGRPCR